MARSITSITFLVRDYNEAINFFTRALRFSLLEDTPLSDGKRWVRVAPQPDNCPNLLLAKAATPEQEIYIGNQTGGRVFLFLNTDNFWDDYKHMQSQGIVFYEEPREESYGLVVVFRDLYGNKWDLIQPNEQR